ncbi:autotransporter domain-containing protein [Telmatospirillum sp.]|uniref:autotransporter domain-containing protein n=1 Tax=Telmatospirillum sp. TaxID=2079197 RepID=UPI0028506810|nr:autotransporter domain-containing protein [Telmatospirillum sp.]MDR3435506.1 autotransporter domain-containing protein [Telmatospirillum sp.]
MVLSGSERKRLRQILLSGASPAVIRAFLVVVAPLVVVPPMIVASPAGADTTISTSITTGSTWNNTVNAGNTFVITPSGTINTGDIYGLTISGLTGGTLVNNGVIIDTAAVGRAVNIQSGTLRSVINTGTISASTYAIYNNGSIGTIINSGHITARIVNQQTIGTFTNTGTIVYDSFPIDNESQIRTFTNSGLISGDRGVYSQGTIGTLVNANTGTITGTVNAITITGVGGINTIANSGQIVGNVLNSGTLTPFISGGAAGTIGTLTGTLGNIGTITNTHANLAFTSGNLYLNDKINVGTGTVSNTGASLFLDNTISVTGTFAQTNGTLGIGAGAGQLVVNTPVSITGGTILSSVSSANNYIAGNYTLVAGAAGSNYTGADIVSNTIIGLSTTASVSGNNVIMTAANDYISGTLGTLTNSGTISGANYALYVATTGSIGTVTNSGTLAGNIGVLLAGGITIGGTTAHLVRGGIGTLTNSGTISGTDHALSVGSDGSLGALANSGVIAGLIENASPQDLTITGGAGATVGTLTGATLTNQGSIINTQSGLIFAGGNLLLNDSINATGHTVTNAGASLQLDSIVSISGAYSQTAGTLVVDPSRGGLVVSNAVNLTGGTVLSTFASAGNYLQGAYTLLSGSSLGMSGATVSTNALSGLYRAYSTIGNSLRLSITNDYIGGTLATLSNSATIVGASTGLYVATTGRIGTLSNTGTLGGGQFGINNRGTIGTLINSGRITNNDFTALWNQGSIGQLTNSGTITNSSWAILNSGSIGTLTNSGLITGAGNAIQNNDVITLVSNSGTMSGGSNVIAGAIATLANSGLILGNINKDGGSISTVIGGSNGTIGTFTGFSGASQGTFGASGNLVFASGNLLLNDSIVAKGIAASALTVSNTGANITLSSPVSITGNYRQTGGLLDLGSTGQLVVSGAASITGGTLSVGAPSLPSTGNYLVGSTLGNALVVGGTGSSYAGVSVTGGLGITGLALAGATSGTNLVLAIGNDYIGGTLSALANTGSLGAVTAVYIANGGSLGTLTNSGTLTGNVYALNNNGALGQVNNGGLMAGDIRSAHDLTIAGSGGRLTGYGASVGTITAPNVVFASGAQALSDAIVAGNGSGTVTNAGATLSIASAISITGNYSQSGGALVIGVTSAASYGELVISGAANLTGGTISIAATGGTLAAGTYTIVSGGTIAQSGLSVSGPAGYTETLSLVGNNLELVVGTIAPPVPPTPPTPPVTPVSVWPVVTSMSASPTLTSGTGSISSTGTIVGAIGVAVTGSGVTLVNDGTIKAETFGASIASGANLVSLSNGGAISGQTGVGNQGSIGTLANSGTISGSAYALSNAGSIGTLANSGLIAGSIISVSDLTISGGAGSMVGTLTGSGAVSQGTITATGVTFTSGSVLLNDAISVGGGNGLVTNAGATITVASTIGITGNYTQGGNGVLVVGIAPAPRSMAANVALASHSGNLAASVGLTPSYGELVVSGAASLTGGTISIAAIGGTLVPGIYSIVSAGTLSESGMVVNGPSGYIETLTVVGNTLELVVGTLTSWPVTTTMTGMQTLVSGSNGSISGTGTITAGTGVAVIGNGSRLSNAGVIDGGTIGVRVSPAGALSDLTNTGVLEGGRTALSNQGSIGALTNSGTISGGAYAISSSGSLGTMSNSGVIAGNILSANDLAIAGVGGSLRGSSSASPGTITAPDVTFVSGSQVLADAIVAGKGSGMVSNNATLTVGQAVGITGNYVQGSSGALVIGIASPSRYGELVVSGSASLTNTGITLVSTGGTLAAGQSYTVVSAGTLTVDNLTVNVGGFLDTVSINGKDLVVSLDTWTHRGDVVGGAAASVGGALDQLGSAAEYRSILSRLAALPAAAQAQGLKQMAPSQLSQQIGVSGATTLPIANAITQHQTATARLVDGRTDVANDRRGALWGQMLGGFANRDGSDAAGGFHASSFGLLAGADTRLASDVVGGVAVSWLRNDANGTAEAVGQTGTQDSYQLSAYGTWRPGGGSAFAQGLLGVGYSQNDQKRRVNFDNVTATASYGGRQYQVKIGGGYDLPLAAGVTATPLASLQAVRMDSDRYREKGAGALDLSVAGQGFNAVESELGGRLAGDIATGLGRLAGDVQLGWTHSYTTGMVSTSAELGGVGLVTRTNRPAADGARIAVGIGGDYVPGLSIRVEYQGDMRADYQSHTGLLRIRSEF